MYYEVADDRLKGKDKQFIWNMGYLKAAEFRWFKENSQDMFESNLVRKFRDTGWLKIFLLPRSSADPAFQGCWRKFR